MKYMNELHAKNFDAILSASLFPTVLREAQAFLDMDVSDVKDNPKFKNRILKIVQGKRVKSTRTPSWRIVLVAALLAISLIFTACMCIPKVREAIWNIIVEWYDEYIDVSFEPENTTNPNMNNSSSDPNTNKTPPSSIEKEAIATYLPEGYYASNIIVQSMFRSVNYYTEDGIMKFKLMQTTIESSDVGNLKVDNEKDTVTTVSINGFEGLMVSYSDSPGTYYLAWQDEEYQYWLYGTFESVSELIKIAQGIMVQ